MNIAARRSECGGVITQGDGLGTPGATAYVENALPCRRVCFARPKPHDPRRMTHSIDVTLTAWTPQVREEVHALLVATSDEFVPPLTTRASPVQAGFSAGDGDAPLTGVDAYLNALTQQTLLRATDTDGRVAGVLSFRHAYRNTAVPHLPPANYITTLTVAPDMRRRGVAAALYDAVLHGLPPALQSPATMTRTWTSNTGHLRLLEHLGFELVRRIENDRGAGIDTVFHRRG